ncbi:MAG: ATP-dependent dethiobiotin synthetase BioD [Acidimicrobiales bacterium]
MTGTRPRNLVVVAGTATEVGKTWVAARLLEEWRTTRTTACVRKPAQSYAPGTGPTDAQVLGLASGEPPDVVCPEHRWYPAVLAPPMAARALDMAPVVLADLCTELSWPRAAAAVGLVETAGGVRSPQADDGDVTDLIAAIRPDLVVLVGDAGLGTINAVRLCCDALAAGPGACSSTARLVVLNRFDAASSLHRANLDWLRHNDGLDVVPATTDALRSLAAQIALSHEGPPAPVTARPG